MPIKRLYFYLAATTIATVFIGGWGFYTLEHLANPGIISYGDAIWFSMGTLTLLGLGDITPTSWAGRLVGMFLMAYGFFFLASFATLNSFYVLQRMLKGKRHRVILEVPRGINIDETFEDLKHLSHLEEDRLQQIEKQFKAILKNE